MGANDFSKEEKVAFDQVLEGFEDGLKAMELAQVGELDPKDAERANNTIWRPCEFVALSFDGLVQNDFPSYTEMSVASSIDRLKSVPFAFDAMELRDATKEGRLARAAKERLSSDVNVSILSVISAQGAHVVVKSGEAAGYADVALIEEVLNRTGVPMEGRKLALCTHDHNKMAADLAGRSTLSGKPASAYEKGYVGPVAGFDVWKLDYALRCNDAAGAGLTMDTRTTASNYHTPKARTVAATGQGANFDNRYQTIAVSSTTGVLPGDAFTVAGVTEAHMITKLDTGALKTFRVISVTDATHMVISPPLISAQGATDAELQYKNCIVDPSATAAISFLNIAAKPANPFVVKGALEILPGRAADPSDSGIKVMRGTTDGGKGLEVVMLKQSNIRTRKTEYRFDIFWGVTLLNPEMAGIALFNQA